MNCSQVTHALPLYIDGALAAAPRYEVEAHLAACPACARECEAQRQLVRLLGDLPRHQLGADFDAVLQARLRALDASPRRAAGWERFRVLGVPRWRPLLAPLALAALLAALWRPQVPTPARGPAPDGERAAIARLVGEHEAISRLRDVPESEAVDEALRAASVGNLIE
jgi:anti-sigma factor RsiW